MTTATKSGTSIHSSNVGTRSAASLTKILDNPKVTVSSIANSIKGYGEMSYYQRQKALAAVSVPRTLKRLTYSCKSKAVRDSKDFDITASDLMTLWKKQKGLCYYSKQSMELTSGTHRNPNHLRVSVDRYDNEKGYVKGNIRLVCWQANQGKGSGTSRAFIQFSKDVAASGRTR